MLCILCMAKDAATIDICVQDMFYNEMYDTFVSQRSFRLWLVLVHLITRIVPYITIDCPLLVLVKPYKR